MTPERWQEVKTALHQCLGLDGPRRAGFLRKLAERDAELRRELESLLDADLKAGPAFLETPAPVSVLASEPDRLAGQRLGPYRLTAEIGAGGMGEVYRAVRADDQYQQEVAIKLVRSGADPAFVAGRLRAERQILASFDHPNIAHLLDGGTTEDGVPYLVMELIEGAPITEYCEARAVDLNARLGLFLQVCDAVQYAHQRMVIHRDLKPSNVLVTAAGVPKLLDFGIAKILEPGAIPVRTDVTISALRILTPEYASPEQLRGEPVTTASDVYSLGVILYELLTGATPFPARRLTHGRITGAPEGEPGKPSAIVHPADPSAAPADPTAPPSRSAATARRRLRGDLDNIALMALRHEPERRYGTVAQLAEDIRRYLTHLPVTARRDTVGYRAARFVRRHTAGVTAGALIALALLGGIFMTAREARLAEAQRARAERRFDDVRKLANSLIFDIHDSLRDLPGAGRSRRMLIDTATHYLDSLTQEAAGDPALKRELAASYSRLGDLQGRALEASEGDYAGARASYLHAFTLLKASVAAEPANTEARRDLIVISGKLSDLLWNTGDGDGALSFSEQTIANAWLLPADGAEAALSQRLLATCSLDYGYKLFKIRGASPAAANYVRQAIASLGVLAAADPHNQRLMRTLGLADSRLAEMLAVEGSYAAALEADRSAHDLFSALTAAAPDNADFGHLAAFSDYDAAAVLAKLGRLQEAAERGQSALAAFRSLSAADPKIPEYQFDVGLALSGLADIEARQHRPQKAIALLTDALRAMPAASATEPGYYSFGRAQAQSMLGDAYGLLAGAQRDAPARLRDSQAACQWYRDSLSAFQRISTTLAAAAEASGRLRVELQGCDGVLTARGR